MPRLEHPLCRIEMARRLFDFLNASFCPVYEHNVGRYRTVFLLLVARCLMRRRASEVAMALPSGGWHPYTDLVRICGVLAFISSNKAPDRPEAPTFQR